eukprot:gene760-48_t
MTECMETTTQDIIQCTTNVSLTTTGPKCAWITALTYDSDQEERNDEAHDVKLLMREWNNLNVEKELIDRTTFSGNDSENESADESSNNYLSSEIESDNFSAKEDICSCTEIADNSDIDEDDVNTVHIGIEQADAVCIKLDDLIACGKIQRDRIFYKCLSAVFEIMYHPYHEYYREVVQFFNIITFLGGRGTTNFIHGKMNIGDGRNSHVDGSKEKKIILGVPSESVCRKYQAAPDCGIIGSLSLAFVELVGDSSILHLIETEALKPAMVQL